MRIRLTLIVVMTFASMANASTPSTQPTTAPAMTHHRPTPLSMREATEAMGLLGPVRDANYTVTFAPPKSDPFQVYRDRYNYGIPSYSPYLYGYYGWPSYGWGGWYGGLGRYGCGGWTPGPTSIFYGD